VVGSSLIGVDPVPADPNADPYFHTRPAASAKDVLGPADTSTSGGSNKAGDSQDLLDAVSRRRAQIAQREGVLPEAVPADAVTASASGLDPDISPEYAALQVARVARVTGLSEAAVRQAVATATGGRILGFLGEAHVDVTELNLAVLDARQGR
jgi:K+-transporting ATPase ATPase C chain